MGKRVTKPDKDETVESGETTKSREMTGNAWQDYRRSRAVTINFEGLGMPDMYVRFMPISTYGRSTLERVYSLSDEEQHIESFKLWVMEWNLPSEDGSEILPIPREDDENTWLDVIPAEVQAFLVREIAKVEKERLELPPEIGGL